MNMFEHHDDLAEINQNIALSKKMELVHTALKANFPFISRQRQFIEDTLG